MAELGKSLNMAAKQFGKGAPVSTVQDAPQEHEAVESKVEQVAVEKNSPWREGVSDPQLLSREQNVSCVIPKELQLRLNFIKNRMNADRVSASEARATMLNLQSKAIDEFTAKILKKWGYDI